MRILLMIACTLVTSILTVVTANAQKRVGLVIGNDRYPNLSREAQLQKAVSDAQAVGDTLAKLGFEVLRGENLSRQQMIDRLDDFANRLSPGDTAFFFFAGHGVSITGSNHFLPTDVPNVSVGQETRLARASLSENDIVTDLQGRGVKVAILVLDACRNNPFRRTGTRSVGGTRGLTKTDPVRGVFTIYSAGLGQEALDRLSDNDANPNSVFTRVLIPTLLKPGLDLGAIAREVREEVAKLAGTVKHEQFPAYYDETLGGQIYLAGTIAIVDSPGASVTVVNPPVDPAERAWNAIKDTTSIAIIEEFLRQHGNSFYAAFARARLDELRKGQTALVAPPIAPSAPPALVQPLGKRVALVVGNSHYTNLSSLMNPKNDATLVAEKLLGVGFALVGERAQIDLDRRSFDDVIRRFRQQSVDAEVALFYFSGHGIQVSGVNYLAPVDANANNIKRGQDIELELLGLDIVVKQMESALPGPNSLQWFSTQPGSTAQDGKENTSPFSTAFARHLSEPIEINDLFRRITADTAQQTNKTQVPWSSGSLDRELYLAGDLPRKIAGLSNSKLSPVKLVIIDAGRDNPFVVAVVPPPAAPPAPTIVQPAVGVFDQARKAAPLTAAEERALKPKDTFKECDACPVMVVVPAGTFAMGSPANEPERYSNEGPQHQVSFTRAFAVGKFSVTFAEWDAFVASGGWNYRPPDADWGRERRPVVNVSWNDVQIYLAWLSLKTGKTYRLLFESEREYVTRAGATTPYWFGATISKQQANYSGDKTLPVDSFQPNPWGFYQVHGNVWEWTEDCWNDGYNGAPTDGTAWTRGDCSKRVVRGGSWNVTPKDLRLASRNRYAPVARRDDIGFRVARTLDAPAR